MLTKHSDLTCAFEIKSEKDSVATFKGAASTSDVDLHNDVIEAGAFDPIATKASPDGELIPDVLMLRDHDRAQIIGGWKSFEQKGARLLVEGELTLEVEKARETYALMKRGYLSGLSVGFEVKDPKGIVFDDKKNRRFIKKAQLRECSIVSFPANRQARILSVKSDIDEWLIERGFESGDLERLLQEMKDAEKPYGDVDYADPGYQEDGKKRYPINNEGRIRAAWNYIHQRDNQKPYTREQVERIKRRIIAAWKRVIDKDGPPASQEDSEEIDLDTVCAQARALMEIVKGRGHEK
jgi:uncharacterized protein